MNRPERDPEGVARALAHLAESLPVPEDPLRERLERSRLLQRLGAEGRKNPSFRPAFRWPAVGSAALVLTAIAFLWQQPKALHYEVIGATAEGAYVSAPSDHAVTVRFSDETRVEVEPSSQLRVESLDTRGARILLERGSTDVHVVHRDRARWSFAAGPFEVLVTGTRFDLNWDPSTQELDLHLREGSVEIVAPFGNNPVSLRAGQDFHADMRKRSLTTSEHAEIPAKTSAPAPAVPSAAPTESAPTEVSSGGALAANGEVLPKSSTALNGTRSWSKLVAAGDFAEVLREAKQRGNDGCMKTCSASDLGALADAARYSGSNALASQSLLALRSRFAETPSGRTAAFLLGRLSEQQGRAAEARAWYLRYLNETPGGAYAAEALAGKMRTTLSLDGKSAAQPIAREYLQLYPNGVHTKAARGITGAN